MSSQNWKNRWTLPEFTQVIDRIKQGESTGTIAHDLGRTKSGVDSVVWIWRAVVRNQVSRFYSKTAVELARQYQQMSKGNGIKPTTEVTHNLVVNKGLVDPFQWVDELMRELKLAIVDAVEYGAKQKMAEKEKELADLRAFKETAQKSNIVDMLRNKFTVKAE